jgi:hypothetical protein
MGCDPCNRLNCEYGVCEDKSCKCDVGYLGDECETKSAPKNIIVTMVSIESLPEEIFGLKKWDDDTTTSTAYLADVMLQVRLGTADKDVFTSVERYPDSKETAFVFKESMRIKVPNPFPEIRLTLSDLDELKPTKMYSITVSNYYSPFGDFPETFEMENEDGVMVLIHLSYEH